MAAMPPDCGVVCAAFGKRAAKQAADLMESIVRTHPRLGRLVVGDTPVPGTAFARWTGADPFDRDAEHNYHFRAGRVKPFLYGIAPWDRTMYIDTDAQIIGDLTPAFAMLDTFEMLTTYHPDPRLHIATQDVDALYNKPRAGWYHNRREREYTCDLFGDGLTPYWNSGVIFWRRCEAVSTVLAAWAVEWQRFSQWDEQLALMRAVRAHPLRLAVLPVSWNAPHRNLARVVYHWYGKGTSRDNGDDAA